MFGAVPGLAERHRAGMMGKMGSDFADNYYTKVEARNDWKLTVKAALACGIPMDEINEIAPADTLGWRKVDEATNKLRAMIVERQVKHA